MRVLSVASKTAAIHPTAVVDAGAILVDGATIGPYCIVGGSVVIGDDCSLSARVHVTGRRPARPLRMWYRGAAQEGSDHVF